MLNQERLSTSLSVSVAGSAALKQLLAVMLVFVKHIIYEECGDGEPV